MGKRCEKRAAALAALPGSAFFKRFRALTIGAYYTTEAGFKDLGYIGNVARRLRPRPVRRGQGGAGRDFRSWV